MSINKEDRFAEPDEMQGDLTNENGTAEVVAPAPSFENPDKKEVAAPAVEEPAEDKKDDPEHESDSFRELRSKAHAEERKRKKLEKELEHWKSVAESHSGKAEESEEPDATKYTDLAKYTADLAAHHAEKKFKQLEKDRLDKETKSRKDAEEKDWEDKIKDARKKYKDFDKTLYSVHDMEVPDHIHSELRKSEYGADMLYHLARNPELASELSSLSPRDAARKLLKLEIQIEEGAKKTSHKKLSSAPAPSTPLQSSTATGEKAVEDMDMDEYRAARKAGKIK